MGSAQTIGSCHDERRHDGGRDPEYFPRLDPYALLGLCQCPENISEDAQERQDKQRDYNEADNIDDAVHDVIPRG